jgi:hypothetical protein
MLVKLKDNFHSISIMIMDDDKTKINISITYSGYKIRGSALLKYSAGLQSIIDDIDASMRKYIGDKSNLCGCKNYGEFAHKVVETIKPATSWSDIILRLNKMGDSYV